MKDLEKDILFQKYKDIVGEIITGEVYQVLSREVLLIDGEGNEISIPRSEQIPKDRYRKGENVRAIVHKAGNGEWQSEKLFCHAPRRFCWNACLNRKCRKYMMASLPFAGTRRTGQSSRRILRRPY